MLRNYIGKAELYQQGMLPPRHPLPAVILEYEFGQHYNPVTNDWEVCLLTMTAGRYEP